MVRASNSRDVASEEEPELPPPTTGAGAGANSLAAMPVVGGPATELGDKAKGERAVAKIMRQLLGLKCMCTSIESTIKFNCIRIFTEDC